MSREAKKAAAAILLLAGFFGWRGSPTPPTMEPPAPEGSMWINRPIKDFLNRFGQRTIHGIRFDQKTMLGSEIDLDKILAIFDVTPQIRQKVILNSAGLDLSGATTAMIPHASCDPWGDNYRTVGMALHVKYMVFDVTTANTQVVIGPSTTVNDCAPITLPTTNGWNGPVDIWVTPGMYIGLRNTNNGGDTSRDITLYGEIEPMGPNGLSFGGILYGADLTGIE